MMLEAVLIDLLRKKGILTSEETERIGTVAQLYKLLVDSKEIDPVSQQDMEVVSKFENLINKKCSIDDKLVMIRRLANKVSNVSIRSLLLQLVDKINEVRKMDER